MEKRTFGKTGLQVSILGFGGAELGFGDPGHTIAGPSKEDAERILFEALNYGINVIDTAECYGCSEESIGYALKDRRDSCYLFTKCGHKDIYTNAAWSYAEITASIEQSLKRLRTDYLDLLQLHSCSKEILQQGEAIQALQDAKQAGKARFIGYSGDGAEAVYAIETGVFDTLQTSINIADQKSIDLLLPLAREKGLGVIAKRPIANVAWRDGVAPKQSYHRVYWERLNELQYNFLDGDLSNSVQTALQFTLSVPGVHTAIVGTSKLGRASENAKYAAKGPLRKDEFEAIRYRWKSIAQKDWVGQE